MATIVVPFRGAAGKRRLEPLREHGRATLALAMLGDVLAACSAVGDTVLVTSDPAAGDVAGDFDAVSVVADPGGGQGAAVAAALAGVNTGPVLVVNADLPYVRPRDLLALLGGLPSEGIALVRAGDGTTNALALSSPRLFAPLYGPRSERRLREHAEALGVDATLADIPNLAVDVDTPLDVERLDRRAGPRTQAALDTLRLELAS